MYGDQVGTLYSYLVHTSVTAIIMLPLVTHSHSCGVTLVSQSRSYGVTPALLLCHTRAPTVSRLCHTRVLTVSKSEMVTVSTVLFILTCEVRAFQATRFKNPHDSDIGHSRPDPPV
jgi:hypothetical protein